MKKINISNRFCDLIHNIYSTKYDFYDDLSQFHKILDEPSFVTQKQSILQIPEIGKNDRDSVFIKDFYRYVDSDPNFMKIYREFIVSTIKPLFSEDILVYQTTPNLRISFPGSTAIGRRKSDPNLDIIGIHKDSEFNHSSYEINFIVPITKMYGTNSLYIEPSVNSKVSPLEYLNLTLEKNELFMGKLNDLKHYNRVNSTGNTRFSLDFRIIPYSKYDEHTLQYFSATNVPENLLAINGKNDISLRSVSCNKKMVVGDYFEKI